MLHEERYSPLVAARLPHRDVESVTGACPKGRFKAGLPVQPPALAPTTHRPHEEADPLGDSHATIVAARQAMVGRVRIGAVLARPRSAAREPRPSQGRYESANQSEGSGTDFSATTAINGVDDSAEEGGSLLRSSGLTGLTVVGPRSGHGRQVRQSSRRRSVSCRKSLRSGSCASSSRSSPSPAVLAMRSLRIAPQLRRRT